MLYKQKSILTIMCFNSSFIEEKSKSSNDYNVKVDQSENS